MPAPITSSSTTSTGYTRFGVLVGAIMVQLILGTVYGYSIFWEPLTAEVFPDVISEATYADLVASGEPVASLKVVATEEEVAREVAVSQGYLKYAFSICILTFALVMVVAGRFQDLKGPRLPAIIGAVLMGAGFLLSAFMNNSIVFYIAHAVFAGFVCLVALMLYHALFGHLDTERRVMARYGPIAIATTVIVAAVLLGNQYVGKLESLDRLFVLWGTIGFVVGAGIGFAYVCPIAALVKWFPQHKGLVSGLAVAGFGFGAYLFSREFGALGFIREFGIVPFFVVHGLVCFVVVTLGALLLKNPPTVEQASATAQAATVADTEESTWQQTVRQPAFYALWLMFFSGAMAGLMVIGIIKVFAGEQLVAAAEAVGSLTSADQSGLMLKGAAAVGWLAIFNALGRIVWGFVSDSIGRTMTFVAMFTLQAITLFVLAGMQTEVTLAIAASVVGFNFGGNFALFPSATADLFGASNLGANYGWVFTSYGIAGVVGIIAGNAAKVMTGSYAAAFSLAAVLCLVSAALALSLKYLPHRPEPVGGA
ncbi:MAG: OFA family MFS transporter [bacterium]|nr:OFA family MFS transporter [bacterium]